MAGKERQARRLSRKTSALREARLPDDRLRKELDAIYDGTQGATASRFTTDEAGMESLRSLLFR
jgi:hypothetical protein